MKLEAMCEVIVDCEHKSAPIDASGAYFAVGTPSMRGNVIDYGEARRISRETFKAWTRRLRPQSGDLLFAREAPVGPVVQVPKTENVAPGQRTMLLRPDASIVRPAYLYYKLSSPAVQDQLLSMAAGSTVAHLNVADMKSFELDLPDLDSQRAIAEVLGALDDKIAANSKVATASARLGRAHFRSASQRAAEQVVLSEAVTLLSRGITPSYTNLMEDSTTVVNQRCIRDHRVDLAASRRTTNAQVRSEKLLLPNDVLVNSTGQGTLGRVARWTGNEYATTDSHVTIIRFDSSRVDPICAGHAVLSSQPQIEALGEGSTGQTELSRVELGKLVLTIPDREHSTFLSETLQSMDLAENSALRENLALAATRDALLPQLMSGRLRVKDAEKAVENVV